MAENQEEVKGGEATNEEVAKADVPPTAEGSDAVPNLNLKEVESATGEENENELYKGRSRLYRYDKTANPPEWKERGVGVVKFLEHKESKKIRVLMRRDKTLKICANHFILPSIKIEVNSGSDRAWMYTTPADFSEGSANTEILAFKFSNPENAQEFKAKFLDSQEKMKALTTSDKDTPKEATPAQ
eukprot:TRINITY_DN22406_c0_g1_i1.p1 TRINITY_DN22406_c0_g1~~TRINITY_DN22406_c0_g1_i1.p1  ORF type:complete len:186 (+),score=63.39 TRINITY_DN22406_c0_g1_i1:88-645(+)